MRKTKVVLSIVGMVMLSFCAISTGAAQDDFSGLWVLDKGKTHDLPSGLESYTMAVTQNQQQLVVETKLEGDLQAPKGGSGEGSSESARLPGGADTQGPFGGGGRGGGGRGGGGLGGGGSPGGGPPSGILALRMISPTASYSLDGTETTVELKGPMPGTAKLKAKWAKDRKGLELSTVRKTDFGGQSVTFTIKERWALSEGGEVLKVQRSVEVPRGADSVKLIFRKVQAEPPTPAPHSAPPA